MANISLYNSDTTIDLNDKVIGTDGTTGVDQGKTKNFTISSLTNFIKAETLKHPFVITGLIEATDDADAASNGVSVGGVYKNSGQLHIREV